MSQKCCYGPYTINSPSFPDVPGPVFIDESKTKQVVTIVDCNNKISLSSHHIKLHELNDCPNECKAVWYEDTQTMGRKYTILATPCEVLITSFDNGLLAQGSCDGSIFGSRRYCYGKVYTDDGTFDSGDACSVTFEFEGHIFSVSGSSGECAEVFDCGECTESSTLSSQLIDDAVTAFSTEIPEAPPEPEGPSNQDDDDSDGDSLQGSSLEGEDRNIWHNAPTEDAGQDIKCFPSLNVNNWPEGSESHPLCYSHDNPAITTLPSGHVAIAYEERNDEGHTAIKLAMFDTSVKGTGSGNKIYYHRSLSYGKLFNDSDVQVYGSGQFEVYDDLYINISDGVPSPLLQIGFLTGPLKSNIFDITSATRTIQDTGLPKWTFTFSSEGIVPDFIDSNNANDVAWFLLSKDDSSLPASDVVSTLFDLPVHTYDNVQVPVSHPSIISTQNNLMIDGTQYVYLSYQAFEDEKWNIYFRQICLNDNLEEEPTYQEPYSFMGSEGNLVEISSLSPSSLTYVVTHKFEDNNAVCALFEVRLPDGRKVVNCDQETDSTITSCNGALEADAKNAVVSATIGLELPGCDGGQCRDCSPPWNVGDSFMGNYPPTEDNVKSALSGTSGDESCITNVNFYPEYSNWCIFEATCQQTFVVDDPYCPSPYLSLTFRPEDLWTINADGEIVTRILYHMSVNNTLIEGDGQTQNNEVDFMFVIDHSGSMSGEIQSVREAVPILAQSLQDQGADSRFGLTVFARGINAIKQPTDFIDCGGGRTFDGLQNVTTGGFTTSVSVLQEALGYWGVHAGLAAPYSALGFALDDSRFEWRPDSAKFVILITDTNDSEVSQNTNCSGYINDRNEALNSLINKNSQLLLAICVPPSCTSGNDGSNFIGMSEETGWTGESYFNVTGPYEAIFESINISTKTVAVNSRVLERDIEGHIPTFLNNAEVLITYEGDLSDLWTFSKNQLEFNDTVPISTGITKGLSSLPRDIHFGRVYGIEPVHIVGDLNKWVFFPEPGPLVLSENKKGRPSRGISEPVLISENSTRSKIATNNRNNVFIAFENHEDETSHIHIMGTGDLHQDSITGPKGRRITKFLNEDSFNFSHSVSLPGEGINQLCDFVVDKNDVMHLTWQSNRDQYWEIYYGNSYNLFDPIRITRSSSRSGFPAIDIDDNGSIFIVYHDNRFGPYEIMMATKHENRVLPLLQQDAYLAGLRDNYQHYVNVLPIFVTNIPEEGQEVGNLIGSKIESQAGNNDESYLFQINQTDGSTTSLSNTAPYQIVSLAGSRKGFLYGITTEDILLQLGSPNENPYVSIDIEEIASIDIGFDQNVNPSADLTTIADMTVDHVGRLWVLAVDDPSESEPSLRLVQISTVDGSIIIDETIVDSVEDSEASVTSLSDGSFVITYTKDENTVLAQSDYPTISSNGAEFNFEVIVSRLGITPQAMASNEDDKVFAVVRVQDDFELLYEVNVVTGLETLIAPIGSDSSSNATDSGPIGTISGLAYLFSIITKPVGEPGYYHVSVSFYDNQNLEGEPAIQIDSRDNLEAFVNDFALGDPDVDPYFPQGLQTRGIFLDAGETGIVFFDATHFRPGLSKLSIPYGFDRNQTYFTQVYALPESNQFSKNPIDQNNTFSCSKCSRFGGNSFDASGCSFSFGIINEEAETQYFNFQIDFYADQQFKHLIRRFSAEPGSNDLQFMEINNQSAESQWENNGLPIASGEAAFVQVYPALDPDNGFLCGIKYNVQVNQCSSFNDRCIDFVKITPTNWISSLIPGPDSQDTSISQYVSAAMINESLAVAWQTSSRLLFSKYDGLNWTTELVRQRSGIGEWISLAQISDLPAIAYARMKRNRYSLRIAIFDRFKWVDMRVAGSFPDLTGVSLTEDNGKALVFFITQNILYVAESDVRIRRFTITQIDTNVLSGSGTDSAMVSGVPHVVYIKSDGSVNVASRPSTSWQTDNAHNTGVSTGTPGLIDINGFPAIAFVERINSLYRVLYKQYDGSLWVSFDTRTGITNINSNIKLAVVNNQPSILYSTGLSSEEADLKYTRYDGSLFQDELVEGSIPINATPIHDIAISNKEAFLIVNNEPFHGYFFNQTVTSNTGITPVYFCECSSNIFDDRVSHIDEIPRWRSSAFGMSDSRITDSPKNSMRPDIKTRSTEASIILWDDYNDDNVKVRGATFRKDNQDQLRSSGTMSWFDYDFNIHGRDVSVVTDLFDRAAITYESPDPTSTEGFHGKGFTADELPSNSVFFKNCDFSEEGEGIEPDILCDIENLNSKVITSDPFVSESIIKKIRIKEEFVDYYTYNSNSDLTPVVSVCSLILEIVGTPEIVAFRIKNEIDESFNQWCPWSPEIEDFYTEKSWTLSPGQGIKEVCIQAITYSGITTEFCLPIVADYSPIIFEANFYGDENYTNKLPKFEGLFVASTGGSPNTSSSTIYVEIVPNIPVESEILKFDVFQQGASDQLDLTATKLLESNIFRGSFVIQKEDKVRNVDGLARIRPRFPESCEDVSVAASDNEFQKDKFNVMVGDPLVLEEKEDILRQYRESISGRVGTSVTIRHEDDPYLVFGDPSYMLKLIEAKQTGSGTDTEFAKSDIKFMSENTGE